MVVGKDVKVDNQDKSTVENPSVGYPLQKRDFAQRPMSMRKFLEPFDHSSLTNKEAGDKYAAYKASFARQQLEDFFEKNKSFAWFREKYHPDHCDTSSSSSILPEERLEIFMSMYKQGLFEKICLSGEYEADIIRILDIVAIKLAHGTDEDIELLDRYYANERSERKSSVYVDRTNKTEISSTDNPEIVTHYSTENDTPHEKEKKIKTKIKNSKKSKSKKYSHRRSSKAEAVQEQTTKAVTVTTEEDKENNHSIRRQDVRGRAVSRSSSNSNSSSRSRSSSSETDGSSSSSHSSDSSSSDGSNSSSTSGSSSSSSSESGSDNSSASETGNSSDSFSSDNEVELRSNEKKTNKKKNRSKTREKVKTSSHETSVNKDNISSNNHRNPFQTRARSSSSSRSTTAKAIKETSEESRKPETYQSESKTIKESLIDVEKPTEEPADLINNHNLRHPVHFNSVLFLPHIPFTIFRQDLISLFSTCPQFVRLAILDPFIVPENTKHSISSQTSDPLFDTNTDSVPKIILKRIGWASFTSQIYQDDSWIDIDLNKIQNKFIQQLLEVQAPNELIECIRSARPITQYLKVSSHERTKQDSYLFKKILTNCPTCIRSKSLLRRHLVLAAKLIYELDKARGFWTSLSSLSTHNNEPNVIISSDMNVSESIQTNEPNQVVESKETMETMEDSEVKDSFEELNSPKSETVEMCTQSSPKSVCMKYDHFDPGEDLIKAATILSSITSSNPLLQGLTDYLVDEGNAEEELLLSGGMQSISFIPNTNLSVPLLELQKFRLTSATQFVDGDDCDLIQVLDRLILYLRIVHSVDFYAPALYFNENSMPHPCYLIHIRPSLRDTMNALTSMKLTQHNYTTDSIDTFVNVFASQLKRLIRLVTPLQEKDCLGLGLRDPEEVVENFIKANTRRKKRKTDVIWVCPLSNKKFRDPIFVKKHILNKHTDKIEATKKDDAFFFNNYLMDPARPQLPPEPRLPNRKSRSPSPIDERQRDSSVNHRDSCNNDRERSDSWTRGPTSFQRQQLYPFGSNQNRDFSHGTTFHPPRMYGRTQYSNFRVPYGPGQRNYFNGPRVGYGSNLRRGNSRRGYIDLDAP